MADPSFTIRLDASALEPIARRLEALALARESADESYREMAGRLAEAEARIKQLERKAKGEGK